MYNINYQHQLSAIKYSFSTQCNNCPQNFFCQKQNTYKNTCKKWSQDLDNLEPLKNLDSPASICLFKVNNENTRTMCEIFSKLIVRTLERRHWLHPGNFEQILHIALMLSLLTLNRLMKLGSVVWCLLLISLYH